MIGDKGYLPVVSFLMVTAHDSPGSITGSPGEPSGLHWASSGWEDQPRWLALIANKSYCFIVFTLYRL